MRKLLIKLNNPFMKWLLRSPLHSMVSKKYMLITLTGRKSGNVYTTPVQYAKNGNTITVTTSKQYTWWKNLRGGAPVKVRVQGHDLSGKAEVSAETEAVTAALRTVYPQMPENMVTQLAATGVAVTIQLDAE
jgi:deazaflavin-dependent oxidoreductase (nitroreductase family)